jgi:hypothetical protein
VQSTETAVEGVDAGHARFPSVCGRSRWVRDLADRGTTRQHLSVVVKKASGEVGFEQVVGRGNLPKSSVVSPLLDDPPAESYWHPLL